MSSTIAKGQRWNESVCEADRATGRRVRIVTPAGTVNSGPPYHGRGGFWYSGRGEGGAYSILETIRGGSVVLADLHLASGESTARFVADSASPEGQVNGRFAVHEKTGLLAWADADSIRIADPEGTEVAVFKGFPPEGEIGIPTWSLDGSSVFVTTYPKVVPGTAMEAHAVYWILALKDGSRREIWTDPLGTNHHLQVCPGDPGLLLIDRNLSPGWAWYGDERRSTRAWLFRYATGELTELRPRNGWRFQMHTNFNRSGDRVYYHGRGALRPGEYGGMVPDTPQYLGVCDLAGTVLWEYIFPQFFYGHVGADTVEEAIIVDGTVSPDLLCRIRYGGGRPTIEILGRHGSDWDKKLGQRSHPHPIMSPGGRYLLFNRSRNGIAEVCLLDLENRMDS